MFYRCCDCTLRRVPHRALYFTAGVSVAGKRGRFPTTRWTLLVAVGRGPSAEADEALATLCQTYWYPLYGFLRSHGNAPDDAADLAQAFFLHLLEKRALHRADPARGRFRTFLLASLTNFVANEHHRRVALKRGGVTEHLSLDVEAAEGRLEREYSTDETPERIFDRRWAQTLLTRVMERLREETPEDRRVQLDQLKQYLSGDSADHSYRETAARLGTTEGALRVAVSRLRRRFRDLVRAEIALTVATPEDVTDEIRFLLAAIRNPG